MASYRIGTASVLDTDPNLQQILAAAHGNKLRPACECRHPPVEMYVAKVADAYLIKRMPNSGAAHDLDCPSYDPPDMLSGLGQVMGTAIEEDPVDGHTNLKFAFSLSKVAGRAPAAADGTAESVKGDSTKLTLRGTLHYLWEQAGLHQWSPGMEGKRNWYVVRKHLMLAAMGKTAKKANLAELLFIPETFRAEEKEAIQQRRLGRTSHAVAPAKGARPLMLVIGEFKELRESAYGYKMVLKHLPDMPLMFNEAMFKRLGKVFETEFAVRSADDSTRLVVIATFGLSAAGVATAEEISLMLTDENWLPFESQYDHMLLTSLVGARRHFRKCLRYNMPPSRPMATAVLTDTKPLATALYVVPPAPGEDFVAALQELEKEPDIATWSWHIDAGAVPELPPSTWQQAKAAQQSNNTPPATH